MKKTLFAAIAAGALAAGGAASAQDFGFLNELMYGTPTAPQRQGEGTHTLPNGYTVYEDANGNQMIVDQYGRMSQPNTANNRVTGYDSRGRPVYDTRQYDSRGRPIYDTQANRRNRDRDGDGVANNRDRWPDDRRHW